MQLKNLGPNNLLGLANPGVYVNTNLIDRDIEYDTIDRYIPGVYVNTNLIDKVCDSNTQAFTALSPYS